MRYHARVRHTRLALAVVLPVLAACNSSQPPPPAPQAKPSADAAFTALAGEYLEDLYRRQPTQATYLGIHKYDDTAGRLLAPGGHRRRRRGARRSAQRVGADRRGVAVAVEPARSRAAAARHRLAHPHARRRSVRGPRDPDTYSSGITNTAYLMIKRAYAPPERAAASCSSRARRRCRRRCSRRARTSTIRRRSTPQIAIDQLDGSRGFFKTAVAAGVPRA